AIIAAHATQTARCSVFLILCSLSYPTCVCRVLYHPWSRRVNLRGEMGCASRFCAVPGSAGVPPACLASDRACSGGRARCSPSYLVLTRHAGATPALPGTAQNLDAQHERWHGT